jgi:ribosomal protein S18 acetylase RimI-like enzyme
VIPRLDHVQVAAPPGCEPAARAFYGGLLGLAEVPKPAALRARGGVWFAPGLHVGVEEPFAPARKAHPALRVANRAALDALAGRLRAAGHAVAYEDGRARLHTADPFGNRVELLASPSVAVRPLREDERPWVATVLRERWGGDVVLADGREHRPAKLPALVAEADGERAGLGTYAVEDEACELVTLDALREGAGAGGALVEAVVEAARAAGCRRVRLVTTNDNLPALRLYQRHGFALVALRPGAVDRSRERKPSIPREGLGGIPLRDELDLVRELT